MSIKKATDVCETVCKMGRWILGCTKNEYFGTLKFDTRHLATLEVLGCLKDNRQLKVLRGVCEGGMVFSSFDAVDAGVTGNLLTPDYCVTSFKFNSFWLGPHDFASKKRVKFRQISFGIHGLDGWYNCSSFELQQPKPNTIEAKYKRPQNVELYADEQISVSIGFEVSTSGISVVQDSIEIEHDPRIVISVRNGKKMPFYGEGRSLSNYAKFVHTFVGIFIGTDAFDYDLRCVEEFPKVGKRHKVKCAGSAFTYYQSREIPETILSNALSTIVPVRDLSSVREAMKMYANIYFQASDVFLRLLHYTYSWTPLTDYSLPLTIFLFERLAKLLFVKDAEVEKERRFTASGDMENLEKIKELPEIKSSKKLSGLVGRIFVPDPSLTDIINVAFNKIQSSFPFLISVRYKIRRDKIIRYLSGRRNSGAHAGKKKFSSELDYCCMRFLLLAMLVLLLIYCGFDIGIVRRYLQRPFTGYYYLAKTLPALLRRLYS